MGLNTRLAYSDLLYHSICHEFEVSLFILSSSSFSLSLSHLSSSSFSPSLSPPLSLYLTLSPSLSLSLSHPPPAPVLAPVPHHHFACCHPGRCHHHPHGSHGLNQTAEVRDEAGGEEEDKPGEPYSTLKTHILIISIIKFFNLSPFEN